MTDYDTSDRDVNRAIRSWLHVDRHEDASRIAGAVLDHVEATPQRRATWWPARRTPTMNRYASIGLGAAAVVVAILIGAQLLGRADGGGLGSPPMPSLESTPTQAPTASPEPTGASDAFLPEGPFGFDDRGTAMTVTIPASGWTFHPEITALGKGDEVANLPEATVLLWSSPAGTEFFVPSDPCRVTSTKPQAPATTIEGLAAALAGQASREASEPMDATIGGHAAKSIILHVPDDAVFDQCEEREFVSYGTAEDPLGRFHQGPGQIDELWIVDVDGGFVIIDAMYRPDTRPGLVQEMRAIAESTTFEAP
jgi:hypothetical protein